MIIARPRQRITCRNASGSRAGMCAAFSHKRFSLMMRSGIGMRNHWIGGYGFVFLAAYGLPRFSMKSMEPLCVHPYENSGFLLYSIPYSSFFVNRIFTIPILNFCETERIHVFTCKCRCNVLYYYYNSAKTTISHSKGRSIPWYIRKFRFWAHFPLCSGKMANRSKPPAVGWKTETHCAMRYSNSSMEACPRNPRFLFLSWRRKRTAAVHTGYGQAVTNGR